MQDGAKEKFCPRCGRKRQLRFFGLRKNGTRRGYCRECEKSYLAEYGQTDTAIANRRAWVANNPEVNRAWRLRNVHGLTLEQYDELFQRQGGRCAICNTDTPGAQKRHWYIDHCHATGRIRGLLCGQCNLGLGQFRDDPALLRAAAKYLTR